MITGIAAATILTLAPQGAGFGASGQLDAKLEGLGACSVSADSVSCWDMNGRADATLSTRLTEYLQSRSGASIQIEFGKKNRVVAIAKNSRTPVGFSTVGDRYLNTLGESDYLEDRKVVWLQASADKASSSIDVIAEIQNIPGPAPVDLPFKVGSRTTYDRRTLEIGKWERSKEGPMMGYMYWNGSNSPLPDQAWWRVIVGTQVDAALTDAGYLSVTPLDGNRQPIPYVDRKGAPITGVKFLEESKPTQNGFPQQTSSKYTQLHFQPREQVSGATSYMSNVDPSKVSFLRVTSVRSAKQTIAGFPLDPK